MFHSVGNESGSELEGGAKIEQKDKSLILHNRVCPLPFFSHVRKENGRCAMMVIRQ